MAKTREEIDAIVRGMSLEEKIRCCALYQDRFGNLPRLGIAFRSCDNSSGGWCDYFRKDRDQMRREQNFWGTSFPQAASQGAAWNPELSREIGEAMGKECKNQHVDILLRPGVNMKRSPLCGRNFEYYSEDPVLSAELGAAFINGVQSQRVAANLKHYVCNNQEYERMTTNAVVDERTLNELYLRVFQLALEKSDPWTMMSSYNRVNGSWVHQSSDLMRKLREDLHYDGLVMSDAFAVHDREDKVRGHKNGLDVELAEEHDHVRFLLDAYDNGEISDSELDRIARHVVDCFYKIHDGYKVETVDLVAHHALAKRAAIEGMVLLENDGVLPLMPSDEKRLAVIGAFAKEPSYMGGGSGHMNGHTLDIPYDEIQRICGDQMVYAPGYQINIGLPPKDVLREDLVEEARRLASEAEQLLIFVGYPYGAESEGYDRTDLLLPEGQRKLLDAVLAVNQNAVLVVTTGAPVDLSEYRNRVRAILQTGYCGEAIGSAVAEILFGLAEPGGRLPETYPLRLEDTPAYLSFPHAPDTMRDVVYGEGLYIGYRWYDKRKMDVSYPFGYGLSYTGFSYSDLKVDKDTICPEDSLRISFRVKNTGSRAGSDVAQIYVRDRESSIHRPEKELRAFKKVYLQPGEEQTVEIKLDRKAFELYTPAMHKWVVEGGEYDILIGRSSREIVLSTHVNVRSAEQVRRFSPQVQAKDFVPEKKFQQLLKEEEEKVQAFFDPEKNPILSVAGAIPMGQFAEADLGQGELSQTFIRKAITLLNQTEDIPEKT